MSSQACSSTSGTNPSLIYLDRPPKALELLPLPPRLQRPPVFPAQIDFIAAYIIPTGTWYILPIAATHGRPDILLNPTSENSRHAQYKEAWHLLKR